jgi:putative DNA primase/helicase
MADDYVGKALAFKRPVTTVQANTPWPEPDPKSASCKPAYMSGLRALTGAELLKLDLPPRELLLSPWLPAKGLSMLHAERGIGKTWVALNVAHALNTAGKFLNWNALKRRRVVYLDGEMPTNVLQQRYAAIVAGSPAVVDEKFEDDDLFRLVPADYQPDGPLRAFTTIRSATRM